MELKKRNPFYIYKKRKLIPGWVKGKLRNIKVKSLRGVRKIQKFFAYTWFPLTDNDRKLLALKNKHKGKRCFVIGNGPSLRMYDLQKIHDNGDISIASNKIFLAFENTVWRPDYYTVIDKVVMENNLEIIQKLPFIKIYPPVFRKYLSKDKHVMYCDLGCEGSWNGIEFVGGFKPGFSDNIINNIYGGESVTYWNIQIAYYLGCREIYLVGVDFSFHIPSKKTPNKEYGNILLSEGEINHFSDKYRKIGETWTMPHLKEQYLAFGYAKEFCEKRGVTIYNASRQSKLDVFERVDFDRII